MWCDRSYGGEDGERAVATVVAVVAMEAVATVGVVVVRLEGVVVPVFRLLPHSLLPGPLLFPAVLAQHRTSQRRRALAGRCVRAGGELNSRNRPGTVF